MLDQKKVLLSIEELRIKYNIPKQNIVADRTTLNWLFLLKLPITYFQGPQRID